MIKESIDSFEGVKFRWTMYKPNDNPKEVLEKYLKHTKSIDVNKGYKLMKFEQTSETAASIMNSYGPCSVIIEYLSDNYISSEGGWIIEGGIENGQQAQKFIEHCLNNYGFMSKTPLHVYTTFSNIPFVCNVSREGKTVNMLAGADHPQALWRERYNIYVHKIELKTV